MSRYYKSKEAALVECLDNMTYTESGYPILTPELKDWVLDMIMEWVYEDKSGPLHDIAKNILALYPEIDEL